MLNKANRDKLRKLHAEFNDDNALLWYSACSDNMMPALDALDALEQERDALAARVAQHERGVASWKEEEVLWKEREAALAARVAELEAMLQVRQRAVDGVIVKSMEIRSNEEALEAVCAALGWDAGEDVCISAMLAAVDAGKRIETLLARVRELKAAILTQNDWHLESLQAVVKAVITGDTSDLDEVLQQALEGAGDAREG